QDDIAGIVVVPAGIVGDGDVADEAGARDIFYSLFECGVKLPGFLVRIAIVLNVVLRIVGIPVDLHAVVYAVLETGVRDAVDLRVVDEGKITGGIFFSGGGHDVETVDGGGVKEIGRGAIGTG